jgi:hypothetical protein
MPRAHTVTIILHMELMEEHMVEHKESMEGIITMDHMEEGPMLQDQTLTLPRITADF